MNTKKCPFCGGKRCIKKGFQGGTRRWQCKDCSKNFQAGKRAFPTKEKLFCLYVFNKQTLKELAQVFHLRTMTIQKMLDEVVLPEKKHNPRPLALCVDTTFFPDFGVVVFRDQKTKEDLWWKFVEDELCIHYEQGRKYLEDLGYVLLSVTADGLPGLPSVFQGIPFQYCHFHAKKNITKYLTRNPKTDAGKELKWIMENLKYYDPQSFLVDLKKWSDSHQSFLDEKTHNPDGSSHFTHRRLRAALKSMWKMSPYLFTYQKYSFFMPVTTNTLEGHFRHLKVRVRVHHGISTKRKMRLVHAVLLNSTAQYTKGMEKRLL